VARLHACAATRSLAPARRPCGAGAHRAHCPSRAGVRAERAVWPGRGRAVTARPPGSRCTCRAAWARCSCLSPPPAPRRLGVESGAGKKSAALRPRWQRRQRRPCSGVSNRASRAGFSCSAPRGRTRRTRGRGQARERRGGHAVAPRLSCKGAWAALLVLSAARVRVSSGLERSAVFAIDDDPSVITSRVRETIED
jgi:hypothetical protein